MKWLWLILFAATANAQEEGNQPKEETDEQKSIRAVSLQDLEEAEEKINAERESLAKSERRLNMLIDDLTNRTADIENRTANLQRLLDEAGQGQETGPAQATQVQLDHWNSRDPVVAAKDFVELYDNEPEVAVSLVKGMKKKKSAALVDEVSKLGKKGQTVAARLHEAIGTGKVPSG